MGTEHGLLADDDGNNPLGCLEQHGERGMDDPDDDGGDDDEG